MKRNKYTEPELVQCQWCNEKLSPYVFSRHIAQCHNVEGGIESYVESFGEFRKNKIPKKGIRNIQKIQCQICNLECSILGMYNHLRDRHEHTPDSYIKAGYAEYRPKRIDYTARSNENNIGCLICKRTDFASHQHFAHHIPKEHGMPFLEYVKIHIFAGITQFCECGCGKEVKLQSRPPYRARYMAGHN